LTSDSIAGSRREADDAVAARAAPDTTTASLAITPRLVLSVVVPAVVALNVLNAVAVFLYHHRHHRGGRFFLTFSLDKEANVPSWFSSALLLTAAAVLALVALDALARNAPWGRHWAGLSLVFVVLSLDETAEIHERIGSWLRGHLDLHGPLHYAGVIPALALAVVVGITYLRFVRALPRATRHGILGAAAVYILGAAGVEAMSGWWAEGHGSRSTSLLLVSTVEENLELIGTTLFILVVLSFLARFGRPVSLRAER
jgi:hypothetical protein